MFRLRSPLIQAVNKTCRNNVIKYNSTKTATIDQSDSSTAAVDTSAAGDSAGVPQTKASGKLATREPLVKNFFVGVVDKELLGYPEPVSRDELAKLYNEVLPMKNFFEESVDTRTIDATRTVPHEVLEGVRELGLYGINAPQEFGGKGWQWTQSLIAAEQEANCTDIALSLLSHRVIIDVLSEMGTDEQKHRFLGKLANGSMLATEAIYEYSPSEDEVFNTTADFNPLNQTWTLNGDKSFVVTGPLPKGASQLYVVISQTKRLNTTGEGSRGTTIFLVDCVSEGVKVGDHHLTTGCRGVKSSNVRFENVIVPSSCVLGNPHDGNEVADVIMRASRLRASLIGLGLTKKVVKEMAHHFLTGKQYGVSPSEMEVNQQHLSKANCAAYAMDSMIYMTSGLLDEFEKQDVALEAAITKYFTLRQLFKIASKCMDIIGPKSLLSGELSEVFFRNSTQLYTQGESMDTLRLFIALTGMQHAGVITKDSVRKGRNPLFHPAHIFGKFLQSSSIDNPKSNLRLGDCLHPTLEAAAQCIENSVARLQMCVELLLTHHGNNIVECHSEMMRLTDMITAIYAMFASVSRASRSYCIGMQLADYEVLTASAISMHGSDLVKTLCTEVFHGQYMNNDNNLQRLSKQLVKSKGYFAVHPLTYNF